MSSKRGCNSQTLYHRCHHQCKQHLPTKEQQQCHTVRSIFSHLDLQRNHSNALHDLPSAKYTRNRINAAHTHMPLSGQSSLRSIFNAIIHMRHTTYQLQKTHAIETKPHTHTSHRQVNLLSDRSSTQSFTCATQLTPCKKHTQ